MAPVTRTENERLAVVETEVRHQTLRHEEFRDEVRGEFRDVKDDVASVRTDVAEIKEILTQAKGGWKAMVLMGSVAGVVLGAVLAAAMWLLDAAQPLLAVLPR